MNWSLLIPATPVANFSTVIAAAEPENAAELGTFEQEQVEAAKAAATSLAVSVSGSVIAQLEGTSDSVTVAVKKAEA